MNDLVVGLAICIVGFGLTQIARAWRRQTARVEQVALELKGAIKESAVEARDAFHEIRTHLQVLNGRVGRQETWAEVHEKRDDETHNDAKDRIRRLEEKQFG